MFESCKKKQQQILSAFSHCHDDEEIYSKIVDFGRELPELAPEKKCEEFRIKGCQSTAYLYSYLEGDKVIFEGTADALISAGLIHLLTAVYSGEPPEAILKCEPDYLKTLGLENILTPGRANGLYSMHLRMKQDAIKYIVGR
ncbi:MAG: SufE family protein [Chlamydiota bacterium]